MVTNKRINAFIEGMPLKYRTKSGKIVVATIKKDKLLDFILYLSVRDSKNKLLRKYQLSRNQVENFVNYLVEYNYIVGEL